VFLVAVEEGRIPKGSVLIVEGLDRLSRAEPIQAQAQLAQIINAGITVVTASDGREYNRERLKAQPMDLVYSLLVMIRAHEESDTKSKRVKAAIRRQCQGWVAGTWRGVVRNGKDPQWVRLENGRFELVPERIEAIRAMLEMFAKGYGSVKMVRELTERGLTLTTKGNGAPHIYKMIRNRALIGEKVFDLDGEEFRLEGYYPPVLTEQEFAELQHRATTRRQSVSKVRGEIPGVVTGAGITYCGYCGATMSAQNLMTRNRRPDGRPQDGHRRLICNQYSSNQGCVEKGSCSVVPVENALISFCSDQLNLNMAQSGGDRSRELAGQLAMARQKAAETEAKIGKITAALLDDSDAAPASILKMARELEAKLADEQARVEDLETEVAAVSSAVTPAKSEAWRAIAAGVRDLDYEVRMRARQLVKETFSRLTVYHHGHQGHPDADYHQIGLELLGKRGARLGIVIDRRTGDWKFSQEKDAAELPEIPPLTILDE
jgi:DNA invertase Pin-like site-specific DNA recombinase